MNATTKAGIVPWHVGGREIALPLICAPMAGGPTTPALVSAIGAAGGLGMLAAGYLSADAFEPLVAEVAATGVVCGVNLFLPGRIATDEELSAVRAYRKTLTPLADEFGVGFGEPAYFDEDIDAKIGMLAAYRPAVVSTTFGDPGAALIARIHAEVGADVAVTVTSVEEAVVAVAGGADLLVAQGIEAGGHRGIWTDDATDPQGGPGLSTLELVAAIRAAVQVPIIAAGGLADGAGIAAVRSAGAVAAQLGTAFLCCDEAGTSALQRAELIDGERRRRASSEADAGTLVTRAFSGRPARSLRNALGERHREDAPAVYPYVHYLTKPLRGAATAAGDADAVNLWAGTGWASVRTGSAADIVGVLRTELEAAVRR
ncbi:nitronate monooxygenase [Gordonia sp. ABSL1-1]|uniref:nitronate monooxygenase n=1 Tax=Gordonia sp. ABSL1-1 TaxID=3053923 RepID=UPI0025724D78|nr:nitronate monooxygenase [Gordonia sp. ABSL1-1]MDL9939009.1 nitronate monooxygenase [Gordonia sp. ABSL1-1]